MITLYGFGPAFGVPDPSPFVLKVDCYLRMANLPFDVKSGANYLRKAPNGKLPYIEDDGQLLADSTFIIESLEGKNDSPVNGWLSEQQQAEAYLLTRSLDEDLYWCIVYSRWIDSATWPAVRESFFGAMPFPLKQIVPIIARRNVRSSLHAQGLGRHGEQEIMRFTELSLQSLSSYLGSKAYFFGDRPCSFDAAAYGCLAQLIVAEIDNPFNQLARKFENLKNYCERIGATYYGSGSENVAAS